MYRHFECLDFFFKSIDSLIANGLNVQTFQLYFIFQLRLYA